MCMKYGTSVEPKIIKAKDLGDLPLKYRGTRRNQIQAPGRPKEGAIFRSTLVSTIIGWSMEMNAS